MSYKHPLNFNSCILCGTKIVPTTSKKTGRCYNCCRKKPPENMSCVAISSRTGERCACWPKSGKKFCGSHGVVNNGHISRHK